MNIIHINTHGSDTNTGTQQNPLATIKGARDLIRKQKPSGAVEILVGDGVYRQCESILFEAQDSGNENTPIHYKAAPGCRPIISGSKKITGTWSHHKDNIYVCQTEIGSSFTQVFVNGKRQINARYPKFDDSVPGVSGYTNPADAELTWPHTNMKYDPGKFTDKKWAHPEDGTLHIFAKYYWGNMQWKLKSIDHDSNTIHFGTGGFQVNDVMQGSAATGINQRSRYFIENIYEELTNPGEWYLDPRTNLLYVIPEEGVDINTALVEVSSCKRLIEFMGSEANPVHHISFSGFDFVHTETTFLDEYDAPSLGDWTIHRGGAIMMQGNNNCTIHDCKFYDLGGNAIFMNLHTRSNTVSDCQFYNIGESAVAMVGSRQLTIGSNHAFPKDHLITRNEIHDIGLYGKQTAGVFISVAEAITVSENHIYRLPRAAICINDGTWGGHIIEYNYVHDTVRETSDHGPFNSWGRETDWCIQQSHGHVSHSAGNVKRDARSTTIIRNNRFEDKRGWGIDLDDGSSNYHVYNNLCIGISFKLREGDFRLVENNIFIHSVNPVGLHIGYENNSDRIVRNIIVMDSKFDNPEVDVDFTKDKANARIYEVIGPPANGSWFKEIDYNLFYNDTGSFQARATLRPLAKNHPLDFNLEEWQIYGFDNNSIYADPKFVDIEGGDYTLLPDSPAFALGFVPFVAGIPAKK